jgi:Ring finger domain
MLTVARADDADGRVSDSLKGIPCTPCAKLENQCAICLAFYGDVRVAYNACDKDCPHVFHIEGITSWLMKSQYCPCCRRQFISLDEAVQSLEETQPNSDGETPTIGTSI